MKLVKALSKSWQSNFSWRQREEEQEIYPTPMFLHDKEMSSSNEIASLIHKEKDADTSTSLSVSTCTSYETLSSSARGIGEIWVVVDGQIRPDVDEEEAARNSEQEGIKCSYTKLLQENRPFRLCLISYLVSHAGEWLTYVATIELLERTLDSEGSSSKIDVSIFAVCRILPSFLLIPFGGFLADAKDLRHSLCVLDMIGACAPLFYLLVSMSYFAIPSVGMIYACTLFQAVIAALYEPCRASIVTMMVQDGEHMEKALTIMSLAWSAMAALGSGIGGLVVSRIGINACFVVDSFTYLCSALIIFMIGGKWNVSLESSGGQEMNHTSMWKQFEDMTINAVKYVKDSAFWPLIFIRCSTNFVFGGSDIINISFAEEDPNLSEAEQSQRFGILTFMVGVGCLLGPLISDHFKNISRPRTVLISCVVGFAFEGIGCLAMGYFTSFRNTAFFTMVRAAGCTISWVDGQILLQIEMHQSVVEPKMYGRVVSLDFGLALAASGLSSMIAGVLQDDMMMNARYVSTIMGVLAVIFCLIWLAYTYLGGKALFGEETSCNNDFNLSKQADDEMGLSNSYIKGAYSC